MAKRGGEAVAKRARERARLAKRQAKELKRQTRDNTDNSLPASSEAELLEAFAKLNADYEAKAIGHDDFAVERDRILGELGIENN